MRQVPVLQLSLWRPTKSVQEYSFGLLRYRIRRELHLRPLDTAVERDGFLTS